MSSIFEAEGIFVANYYTKIRVFVFVLVCYIKIVSLLIVFLFVNLFSIPEFQNVCCIFFDIE